MTATTLACSRIYGITWPSSHETIKAKLPYIARRSGACAEIIGLLSLTPEEAHSLLDGKEIRRLYAPAAYWRYEKEELIRSQS